VNIWSLVSYGGTLDSTSEIPGSKHIIEGKIGGGVEMMGR
jgi:hypothetical protein